MFRVASPMRLFLSLPLPVDCQQILDVLEEPIRGVRWVPSEQRHLTLRFIGDWEEPGLAGLQDALAQVRIEPFLLPLTAVGNFPPRGPSKVLWVGVGAGHSRLFQLRQRVDDTLLRLGWQGDLSTFEPHITLARVADAPPAAVSQWVRRHREYAGPSFLVKSFDLRSSELRPSGAVHTLVRVFPLEA